MAGREGGVHARGWDHSGAGIGQLGFRFSGCGCGSSGCPLIGLLCRLMPICLYSLLMSLLSGLARCMPLTPSSTTAPSCGIRNGVRPARDVIVATSTPWKALHTLLIDRPPPRLMQAMPARSVKT